MRNVRQRCDAMAALVRECEQNDSSPLVELVRPEVARGLFNSPKSELMDSSRPLRTPPKASEQKSELTAEAAVAPANLSASHVSRRWRKGGRPLRSKRRPGTAYRSNSGPLPRRVQGSAVSLRRQIYGAAQQLVRRHPERQPDKRNYAYEHAIATVDAATKLLTIYQVSRHQDRPSHQGRRRLHTKPHPL